MRTVKEVFHYNSQDDQGPLRESIKEGLDKVIVARE
jgi:hypothetical protein